MAKLGEEIRAKKLANDRASKLLMLRADAETAVSELCLFVKDRLEKIPDEVEMMFPPLVRQAVKQELAAKIDWILRQMAEHEI